MKNKFVRYGKEEKGNGDTAAVIVQALQDMR